MKRMIFVVVAFCLVTLSCQVTQDMADAQVADDMLIYDGEEDSETIVTIVASETIVTFADIQFQAESAVLLESEIIELQEIAEILLAFPDNDLLVVGHAVFAGSEEGRQKLSQERAYAVADYLVALGAKMPEQLSVIGVGATEQIVPDDTPQNKARNRRVEITMIE